MSVTDHQWFTDIADSTQADWDLLAVEEKPFQDALPDRIMDHLRLLDDQGVAFHVTRLDHSLQSATLAARANRDDEYVVSALVHDIGDSLACFNHADLAAAVLKPFVRPEYHWMVEKHAVFQGYYFWHYMGRDRNARDAYKDHPQYDLTVEFCAEYDGPAFDPKYPNMPLEEFEPLVRQVFSQPRW